MNGATLKGVFLQLWLMLTSVFVFVQFGFVPAVILAVVSFVLMMVAQ